MEPVEQDVNRLPEDESIGEEFEREDGCIPRPAAAYEGGSYDDVAAAGEKDEQDKEGKARDTLEKAVLEEKDNRCACKTTPPPEVRDEAKKKDACASVSESRQKWVAFLELPGEVVNLALNSVIPPDVIKYYKQFGLNEENIKLIFQMRPSEEASHKPVGLPPFKGAPRPGG